MGRINGIHVALTFYLVISVATFIYARRRADFAPSLLAALAWPFLLFAEGLQYEDHHNWEGEDPK